MSQKKPQIAEIADRISHRVEHYLVRPTVATIHMLRATSAQKPGLLARSLGAMLIVRPRRVGGKSTKLSQVHYRPTPATRDAGATQGSQGLRVLVWFQRCGIGTLAHFCKRSRTPASRASPTGRFYYERGCTLELRRPLKPRFRCPRWCPLETLLIFVNHLPVQFGMKPK